MSKTGPIVLVEDDVDDKELFEGIVRELGYTNEIKWFDNAREVYNYLCVTTDSIFIIFCDINMPGQNGIELKKNIDSEEYLREKSIPFIFYTTTATKKAIDEAYNDMTVQGFFKKGDNYNDMKNVIAVICDYWKNCHHPNGY